MRFGSARLHSGPPSKCEIKPIEDASVRETDVPNVGVFAGSVLTALGGNSREDTGDFRNVFCLRHPIDR